ncbi:MAG TPA: alpha/beta fold hydrolase [Chthoniobacterales bacterium]
MASRGGYEEPDFRRHDLAELRDSSVMKSIQALLIILSLALAACAPLVSVKTQRPAFVPVAAATAEKTPLNNPLAKLGGELSIARVAAATLQKNPADENARQAYNYSVARALETIQANQLNPWDSPLKVPGPDGDYILTAKLRSGPEYNPKYYNIIPTDTVRIRGKYFTEHDTEAGVGAPIVAVGRGQAARFRKTFAMPRVYTSRTAVVRFNGHHAQFEFVDPFSADNIEMNGRRQPLAADYSTFIAMAMARERPDRLGLIRMLRPARFSDTARLTRLQPYDPTRIPVLFVHGLQDTPASWAPMINSLLGDPEIRKRYQFWVYSYPSGYPYPYSASLLRKELDAVGKAFPGHKKIVLVGHSMGGIISRLMVTDAGDKLWRRYFGEPPAETRYAGPTRKIAEDALIFNHRMDVSRVVFICAPHRGSLIASNWIGRLGSRLIKPPQLFTDIRNAVFSMITVDPSALKLNGIPNSIDTLAPNDRFVREINKIPITPGIPYHTILGDRGRGDSPNSSDGVVPYWSAHLDGAQSEDVVPTGHGSLSNQKTIEDVRRILKQHIASTKGS